MKLQMLIVFTSLLGVGCQKNALNEPEILLPEADRFAQIPNSMNSSNALSSTTLKELSIARAATAKYHDIDVALAEGYVDINYVVPHMGHHYMKVDLLDDIFDPRAPEILVYQFLLPNKKPRLVALEYAFDNGDYVNPPGGFYGNDDTWNLFTPTGPWVLHPWIWSHNSDGIFNPHNPRLP